MPRDFLLILRTRASKAQATFRELLEQENIVFRVLYCQPGHADGSEYFSIENVYVIEADFCSLSGLKQTIETRISYEALLLFEYISW